MDEQTVYRLPGPWVATPGHREGRSVPLLWDGIKTRPQNVFED